MAFAKEFINRFGHDEMKDAVEGFKEEIRAHAAEQRAKLHAVNARLDEILESIN